MFVELKKLPFKLICERVVQYVINFLSFYFDDLCKWNREMMHPKQEKDKSGM